MATKIIVDKRRTGKTTKAILESAKTGKYILVANMAMARFVDDLAIDLGVRIPYPITQREWERGVGSNVRRSGIIIDEGLMLLESILGTHIHMITMSEREDE